MSLFKCTKTTGLLNRALIGEYLSWISPLDLISTLTIRTQGGSDELIFSRIHLPTHTMLFWLSIILLVLFSSAQASKPICDGRCTAPMVSIFSKVSNFHFFSGLARGCRPSQIDHINQDIFINFQPISMKFKFYQSQSLDLKESSPKFASKSFQSSFWSKIWALSDPIAVWAHHARNTAQVEQVQEWLYPLPHLWCDSSSIFSLTSVSSLARIHVWK